jgi:hypothetical protein
MPDFPVVDVCDKAQLVKRPGWTCEDMGSAPAGIAWFFQSVWRILLVWFWLQVFFHKLTEFRTMDYRNAFFKLPDYQNIEYRTGKLGKLSDYWISDTKLKLWDCHISENKLSIAQLCLENTIVNSTFSVFTFLVDQLLKIKPIAVYCSCK